MKEVISKELLSEVLGNVSEVYEIKIANDTLFWNNGYMNKVGIHDFMSKCKENALSKGFHISSKIYNSVSSKNSGYAEVYCEYDYRNNKDFYSYSEFNAVICSFKYIMSICKEN